MNLAVVQSATTHSNLVAMQPRTGLRAGQCEVYKLSWVSWGGKDICSCLCIIHVVGPMNVSCAQEHNETVQLPNDGLGLYSEVINCISISHCVGTYAVECCEPFSADKLPNEFWFTGLSATQDLCRQEGWCIALMWEDIQTYWYMVWVERVLKHNYLRPLESIVSPIPI